MFGKPTFACFLGALVFMVLSFSTERIAILNFHDGRLLGVSNGHGLVRILRMNLGDADRPTGDLIGTAEMSARHRVLEDGIAVRIIE